MDVYKNQSCPRHDFRVGIKDQGELAVDDKAKVDELGEKDSEFDVTGLRSNFNVYVSVFFQNPDRTT